MTTTSPSEVVVKAREPAPPRRWLPEPSDIVEIAHVAQQLTHEATIQYRYGFGRRELYVCRGGWMDRPLWRDYSGVRG